MFYCPRDAERLTPLERLLAGYLQSNSSFLIIIINNYHFFIINNNNYIARRHTLQVLSSLAMMGIDGLLEPLGAISARFERFLGGPPDGERQ